jgi:hypothetical protein
LTTWRRCPNNECRHWYEKEIGDCPKCEAPAARHNKWLAKASLNSQLWKQAEASQPKAQYEKNYKHYRKKIKSAVKEGVWSE